MFPPYVKLLLMSQSDFSLPYPAAPMAKKYDFTFSMSDHNVATVRFWFDFLDVY